MIVITAPAPTPIPAIIKPSNRYLLFLKPVSSAHSSLIPRYLSLRPNPVKWNKIVQNIKKPIKIINGTSAFFKALVILYGSVIVSLPKILF